MKGGQTAALLALKLSCKSAIIEITLLGYPGIYPKKTYYGRDISKSMQNVIKREIIKCLAIEA